MIIGIGNDIVDIDRIKKIYNIFPTRFINRLLTENERNFLKNRDQTSNKIISHIAKRFAAKEAFAKALGVGIGATLSFKDIEIYNDKLGAPKIKKSEKINSLLGPVSRIHLSISDEKNFATAFVVIEK